MLTINKMPQDFGRAESRWTLDSLLEELQSIFSLQTISGLWKVLKRLKFSYQKARAYVHSPDSCYDEKLMYIKHVISMYESGKVEVLFADQFTYYNHPGVNCAYAPVLQQPKCPMALGGEKQKRIAACMNCFTGKVDAIQRNKTTIPSLVELYKKVRASYPNAETIYIIMDNWPVHYHPDIMRALVPQTNPFKFKLPKSWENLKPSNKYAGLNLPIQIVSLPTYASWLNPIEKLWKMLKKDIIHHHSFAHNFNELFTLVEAFLSKLEEGSTKLLSYTGLLKTDGIFSTAISKAKPDFFKLGG